MTAITPNIMTLLRWLAILLASAGRSGMELSEKDAKPKDITGLYEYVICTILSQLYISTPLSTSET